MKIFSNTRTKRTTAFVVLLVWLFALASGVANACLLKAGETYHSEKAGTAQTPIVATISSGQLLDLAVHDLESELSKAPCLKVCNDGSQSIVKYPPPFDLTNPGPAPLVAVLWTEATPLRSATHRMSASLQPAIPGLPVRLRYVRLAL